MTHINRLSPLHVIGTTCVLESASVSLSKEVHIDLKRFWLINE